MKKEKALLLAANLKGDFGLGHKDVGSVLAHASHIEKEGAAMWTIVPPGQVVPETFKHPEIKRGYFYNVADKAVTHVFDIEYISTYDEIHERGSISKYLIDSRKFDLEVRYFDFYWLKITGIYRLKRDHQLRDFKLHKNGNPVPNCRNYVIVEDPRFQHYNKKITRREIMSEYIGDLLCVGRVTEADIEELFSYRLADKLALVERQGSFQRGGRLDLLYKKPSGQYMLFELKKGNAKVSTLEQIKGYLGKCKEKYGLKAKDIRGIILARSIDPELYKALANEKNIEAKTYYFSIEMK